MTGLREHCCGNSKQPYVPRFSARKGSLDPEFGLKIFDPRMYLDFSYLNRTNNTAIRPKAASVSASTSYPICSAPSRSTEASSTIRRSTGTYPNATAASDKLEYIVIKYSVGGAISFGKFPLYSTSARTAPARNQRPRATPTTVRVRGLGFHF